MQDLRVWSVYVAVIPFWEGKSKNGKWLVSRFFVLEIRKRKTRNGPSFVFRFPIPNHEYFKYNTIYTFLIYAEHCIYTLNIQVYV